MSEKIALVTGGGSGIGKHVALGLMRNGWSVAVAGRRREPLEVVVSEGGRGLAVTADVADSESVSALFNAVKSEFGRLDLLFNNAGIFPPAVPIEDLAFADWKAAVDINVNGAFLCTQAAFRIMKAQQPQGGRIINNGSISAHAPRPNAVGYTTTKHAITGLTKSTALDGRKYNIACGQIDIGNTATDMTDGMGRGMLQANGTVMPEPTFGIEHTVDAALYMAGLPLEANVLFMTVLASQMPFVGRG